VRLKGNPTNFDDFLTTVLRPDLNSLREHLKAGSLMARDLVQHSLGRIAADNEDLNALVVVRAQEALAEAEASDRRLKEGRARGPLEGIPVVIKNNLSYTGAMITASSRILEGYRPPFNATAVEKLLAAGAIVVGVSNMDEFAMGSSNENSANGPVKNPWDRSRVPGGSSGGSAAAVAAGFAPMALGSDTGGSIRQPASFCGVTGLKPTYGSVSRYGLFAYGSSLDQIGPLAHSVADVAEVFEVIRGRDPRDMTSVDARPMKDWTQGVEGLRIGVPVEFFDCDKGLRPELKSLLMKNLEALQSQGAKLVEVHLPILDHVIPVYYLIANCEASSNLSRYDGIRFGRRADKLDNLLDCFERSRQEGFGREVQTRVMLGTYALSAGYYDAFYKKADAIRSDMRRQLEKLFQVVDVLAGPTTPDVAFRLGDKVDDPLSMYMQDLYTTFVNLVGGPALSLPCGMVEGLPVGLQIVGRDFDEASLFRVGKSVEAVREFAPCS